MTLPHQAALTLRHHTMLSPGDHVVAGLSGGADSVALLHWLCSIREEYKLTLAAAHINHSLRGEESDGDEAFCRAFCEAMNVPLHVKRVDVAALAREQGLGIEEAGRGARYAFFEELGGKIALAHTLSDRAETFLLNIARGTALRGLCSIPPTRGSIIRPLIECTRAQVEEYCRANGLDYRTDSSNFDSSYRRNFVRAQVLPLLDWNPEHLRRMFRCLEEDEAYLSGQAAALSRDEILAAPGPLKNRALRLTLVSQGREPTHARMRELEKQWKAVPVGGACKPPAALKKIKIEFLDENFIKNLPEMHKEDLANCLDYDTIIGEAVPGRRAAGDRMRLCNGAGTKPLKKLCQERGIAPGQRERLCLLRDGAGLVWIEGMGCAHRCRVTAQTKRAARVEVLWESTSAKS